MGWAGFGEQNPIAPEMPGSPETSDTPVIAAASVPLERAVSKVRRDKIEFAMVGFIENFPAEAIMKNY